MIYLIGGPARVGKSTLAKKLRKVIDGQVLSGDAFVCSLHDTLDTQWLPDLFVHGSDPVGRITDPQEKVDRLRRRDKSAWAFYDSYIRAVAVEKDNLLLEGNIWPDYLSSLDVVHRAVFLVDTSPDHIERLITIRDSDDANNWMRDFSDEKMATWAQFNIIRSRRYIEYCQAHQYPYFDIAGHGIEVAEQLAFEYLLGKDV